MALMHVNFHSESLGMETAMNVIVPQFAKGVPGIGMPGYPKKLPALYLLHGLSGDESVWMRRTSIERYAAQYPLVIIMPDGGRSFYTDMHHGYKYWTFVSRELPAICEGLFPISSRREDRFAAGLSMGGYGAMKLGLGAPNRFSAVASLSGAIDMRGKEVYEKRPVEFQIEMQNVFGDPEAMEGSFNDLFALGEKLRKAPEKAPKMYMACGTEDDLLPGNRKFRDAFGETFDLTYEEGPGDHTWDFWDTYIRKALAWLPIDKRYTDYGR